jgi:hypothetical protein
VLDELSVSGAIARDTRLRLAKEALNYLIEYDYSILTLLQTLERG